MSDDENQDDVPKKKSKLPLIVGVVLALVGGGGGFFAVSSGMILGGSGKESSAADGHDTHGSDSHGATADADHGETEHGDSGHGSSGHGTAELTGGYLEIDPIVVTLPPNSRHSLLRFTASLELDPAHASEVAAMKPRIIDVMNTYLRSIDSADLDKPGALSMIRSHLLARMHIIAGPNRVQDILIMEFILT